MSLVEEDVIAGMDVLMDGVNMENALYLISVAGPNAGKKFAVSTAGATLGRSRTSTICLEDSALSRQHCQITFSPTPQVADLDSSNGTLLNGTPLTNVPTPLANGDVLSMGEWIFRVEIVAPVSQVQPVSVEPKPAAAPVTEATPPITLFGEEQPSASASAPTQVEKPQTLFDHSDEEKPLPSGGFNIKRLILPIVAVVTLALGVTFLVMGTGEEESATRQVRNLPPTTRQVEFSYERFVTDARHLFRYTLSYDAPTNVLFLEVNDLGDADRSFTKKLELPKDAKDLLTKMILEMELDKIGEIFREQSEDGISVERRTVTIVRGSDVWTRTAENVKNLNTKHVAFSKVCDQLETFAKNELKVWAAEYSIDELAKMAAEQLEVAKRYWEQRDLGDEKLWFAIVAYRKGISALDTLNPKPAMITELSDGLFEAEALLAKRYEDSLFQVEQAMNTQQYEVAMQHLQKILRMIPDRDDSRHGQASEKLLMVERRRGMKGGR